MRREIFGIGELLILIVSLFAFAYILADASGEIKLVSAQESGDIGCCEQTVSGDFCASVLYDECASGAGFAENAVCDSTQFCQKGCCFDEDLGIYDPNVLQKDCSLSSWDGTDPTCNVPGADTGCCILGNTFQYETFGECKTDTELKGLENVDWRGDLSEFQCISVLNENVEGACVMNDGTCSLITGQNCDATGGEFYAGKLCTASGIDSTCQKVKVLLVLKGLMEFIL